MTTERINQALVNATETKLFWLGTEMLPRVAEMFKTLFPGEKAALVADRNTLNAAGREVYAVLRGAGVDVVQPYIFEYSPHAEFAEFEKIKQYLTENQAIAVAVGAGSINDICKYASEQVGQRYLCVATAASVDGYASSGAPITIDGFKKTAPCKAPLGIVADLDVLLKAPYALTASGYADLVAKVPGGADWLIADTLEAGPESTLHQVAWNMVQLPLEGWINHPYELKEGDESAFSGLIEGLTLSGFGMQAAQSSRPASGCEHMFSHVWEMSGLKTVDGVEPSHGFKVAIGSLASTAVMERVFSESFTVHDIEEAIERYPSWDAREEMIRRLFGDGTMADKIVAESRAKHLDAETLRARLEKVAASWETLKTQVEGQVMSFLRMREMFRVAGCPTMPQDIGLSVQRCAVTAVAAQMIRSRYTVLDLAYETGRFHEAIDAIVQAFSDENQ